MEDFILIRPTSEYASQLAEYRQEFLNAGDSMDGCGPLRRFEDPEEYIQLCKDYEDPKTVPSHLVPSTQFLLVRKRDNRLVGMIQVRHDRFERDRRTHWFSAGNHRWAGTICSHRLLHRTEMVA